VQALPDGGAGVAAVVTVSAHPRICSIDMLVCVFEEDSRPISLVGGEGHAAAGGRKAVASSSGRRPQWRRAVASMERAVALAIGRTVVASPAGLPPLLATGWLRSMWVMVVGDVARVPVPSITRRWAVVAEMEDGGWRCHGAAPQIVVSEGLQSP
jgi:hypothetical protein